MNLDGKTAVITGASRGIGAALARMLHARGVNLGLASRSGDDLGLAGAVSEPCDVRDLDALTRLCDATAAAFGGIDIVVANAGVGAYGPFLELSREHLDEMLDVNLKGTLYAIRAALPHMLGRGRTPDALPGMMTAEDVAEVVVFALERPRHLRILETALRPMTEGAWG